MKISEVTKPIFEAVEVDNQDGLGATSYNMDIHYFGVRAMMRPSRFLSLTSDEHFVAREESVEAIINLIEQGNKIASPFLIIEIPDRWVQEEDFRWAALVEGHEGRHRMEAIRRLYGDEPVETHVILRGKSSFMRARHIKQEWLSQIEKVLKAQFTSKRIMNPFVSMGEVQQ